MEALYVVEQGCVIKKQNIMFVIFKNGIKIREIPSYKVDRIMLFGNQHVTSQAMNLAFENNIDILFLSSRGRLLGKVCSINSKNIFLRLIQYETWRENTKKFEFAKTVVRSKIKNQYTLLKRYDKGDSRFNSLIERIDSAKDIEGLMGIEGIAGRYYFENFKFLLPEEFLFNGRNRRPPKDEINALLSLTYTMTVNHLISEIEIQGLDGYIGFLHGIKYGRVSLAMDILEELRQSFCDQFVLKLVKRKEITKKDFVFKDRACLLTEAALRTYLEKFNEAFMKWDKTIKTQVSSFKEFIVDNKEYTPVKYKW